MQGAPALAPGSSTGRDHWRLSAWRGPVSSLGTMITLLGPSWSPPTAAARAPPAPRSHPAATVLQEGEKAMDPHSALPTGLWAPRAEGDRQTGSKAWCQPSTSSLQLGRAHGGVEGKGSSSITPRPSVIFHPAVLRDEGVDHLLHGEVGDELVLGQGTPRHGIEMTHALQGRWPGTGYTACLAPGQQHRGGWGTASEPKTPGCCQGRRQRRRRAHISAVPGGVPLCPFCRT